MATFIEAMRAAREGMRIRRLYGPSESWMRASKYNWMLDEANNPVQLNVYDDTRVWEIEAPPPREYTFMEAIAMMEKGKKMRSTSGIYWIDDLHCLKEARDMPLHVNEMKGKWTEVV